MFMDGIGVRPSLLALARTVAIHGYFVALPDLYYRSAPFVPLNGTTAFSDAAERQRLMTIMKEVTAPRVLADARALLEAIGDDPAADTTRVGTVGYCMGGGVAIRVAGAFPDRVRAAASYHGGRLATDAPDSPHVTAANATAQLYVGYAEHDASFPEDQRARLETALAAAGVPHTIEKYHAAHGFAIADTPAYDKIADERHWATLLALFGDKLTGI
jgi:carboxymethylenebutenolidase